jgi:predicted Zn-dependent protease with MMP-like domain
MDRERFENLVARAVEDLPEEFQERLENIDVVVEDSPSPYQMRNSRLLKGYALLGLYEGVPLTERNSNYGMVPPDKITVFQKSIENECQSRDEMDIKDEIRRVVLHEIAHHFGIGDTRLKEIEDEKRQGEK